MADVLGSLNQATAKKKVAKKPVAAFDALSVLGNALNAAPPVKRKPLMAQPVAGTRVDGVLNETTGQLTAKPLMAQPVPGTSANGLKNEATGEVQNAQGQKVKRYNLALENGVNLSFDSNRELTPDELQQAVNDIGDRKEFKKLEKVAAAKKKERSQMATPNVGPYSNRRVQAQKREALQAEVNAEEKRKADIANFKLRPNGQPTSGMDWSPEGIVQSLQRIAGAVPKAADSLGLLMQGLTDPNVKPDSFDMREGVSEKGRAQMNPSAKITSAAANVGSYFVPGLGALQGAVQGINMGGRVAAGEGQQVVNEAVTGLNVFDPNIDPVERGVRAINVLGTIYGGYQVAKGVSKLTRIADVSKQLGVNPLRAEQIVNWAEEASAKAPKRTGINKAGREDAKGTAASIALGNYEPPVAAGRGASNVPIPTTIQKPELKPAPTLNIPGKQGPQPATFEPTVSTESKLGNPNEKTNQQTIRNVQEGQGIRNEGKQFQGQGNGQKANAFVQEKGQVTPESVGVKSGMQDPHAGKTGVWKGPDADQPIKIEKTLGTKDGRTYVKVEGSNTGIPLDEITVDAPKPSGTRTRASKAEPTPVAPTAGEPNQTGIKMSTRSEEAARGLTSEPVSIGGKPLTELQREGVARVESGKVDPYDLVQTLATKGRPATDVEYGSIAAGRAKLIKRAEEAQTAYDNATGAAKEEARAEYHKALDAATEFDGHLDKVKSASGRSLNALKIGSNLNEASSAEVLIEARRRNPKVSPKKEAELTNLANTVRDTNVADNAAVADAVVSQAKADPVYSFKGKKEAIRAERNTLLQQLEKARKRGNSGSNVRGAATLPTDILKLYGKIGLTYAKEGLVTFEEIADAIRSHAKANGHGLSDDDVHEALRSALPAGRKLTELELKNRRLNEIARNRIRAILGDLKPVSGVKRVENVLRESQLSNPVSRVMDWLSNEATKLAYIAESPVRYVVTRGKEKPIGPVAYRELMRGSRDRWAHEAAQVMAGADPDAIAKYGKAPGIVSKVTGLSDIQFKDFYHQVVYRDVAVKTHPKDIKAQREMIDQLNGITDGGPLSDGAIADIQAEANDFALRKTFNADNWFASATTAGAGTLRREAFNGMVKQGVSEKAAANVADLITFIPNVAFRYSKVIGNVAHDSVTRTGVGMLEASAGRIAAGMKVEREGLRIRLRRAGISDAQSRILSDKFARGLTGAALTGIGAAIAAKGIMKPDVVKTSSGYFFDYGELEQLGGWVKPLLVGSTIQTINEMNISDDEKKKLIAKAVGDIALSQPLTSGFKQLSNLADTTNAPKALGRIAATALVPGIVAGAARMHDKMTTGTGYRKTKGPEDEFKSRIPVLRQQLDSGEKSRTKGRPGLPL